jgi:hypothetical protein
VFEKISDVLGSVGSESVTRNVKRGQVSEEIVAGAGEGHAFAIKLAVM